MVTLYTFKVDYLNIWFLTWVVHPTSQRTWNSYSCQREGSSRRAPRLCSPPSRPPSAFAACSSPCARGTCFTRNRDALSAVLNVKFSGLFLHHPFFGTWTKLSSHFPQILLLRNWSSFSSTKYLELDLNSVLHLKDISQLEILHLKPEKRVAESSYWGHEQTICKEIFHKCIYISTG